MIRVFKRRTRRRRIIWRIGILAIIVWLMPNGLKGLADFRPEMKHYALDSFSIKEGVLLDFHCEPAKGRTIGWVTFRLVDDSDKVLFVDYSSSCDSLQNIEPDMDVKYWYMKDNAFIEEQHPVNVVINGDVVFPFNRLYPTIYKSNRNGLLIFVCVPLLLLAFELLRSYVEWRGASENKRK